MLPLIILFAVSVMFTLAFFWISQFVFLMSLEADQFPWPYDKALWVATFLLAAPLAPFAFYCWRNVVTLSKAEDD